MSKLLTCTLLLILISVTASSGRAETAASVKDLAWMTGSWAGPVGQQTLEENWIQPSGGSIASLVRMTGNGATSMIEMIVIEEEDDSLVLRIQQWNPGFKPRTPEPQTMKLVEMGKNRVGFKATESGGMNTLTYSRPNPDTFNIDIESGTGAKFQINLKARK